MKHFLHTFIFCVGTLCFSGFVHAQSVFINEIHYDNDGADTGEAIEIAGPAGTNLSAWSLVLYNGSNSSSYTTSPLTGTITDQQNGYGTIVVAYPPNGIQNGSPDGIALVSGSTVVQFLSYEGTFTATGGPADGLLSTDIGVTEGSSTPASYSLQLTGSGNSYEDFTWAAAQPASFAEVNTGQAFEGDGGGGNLTTLLINEIDADTPGSDTTEFIELYDGGTGNTSLNGWVVVLYNGSNDAVYASYDLTGYSTDEEGYFVLGNAGTAATDLIINNNALQNGADAVALYQGTATNFPNGTAITTEGLVDAIVYDTDDADDAELLLLLNAGQPQVNEDENNDKDNESLQRIPNGTGGLRNTATYTALTPTPGASNGGNVVEPPVTPGQLTLIHDIQGTTGISPLAGQTVTIKAIVVGDFQADDGDVFGTDLGGFYVQEEAADFDANDTTSEGILVYTSTASVNIPEVTPGDTVTVTGSITEFNGLTELTNVAAITVGEGTVVPTPVAVLLPADNVYLERYEGMLVSFTQSLVISEYFNYDRYNEVVLSLPLDSLERPFVPTSYIAPGAEAAAIAEALTTRRITLDDARTIQNPDMLYHPNGQVFSNENNFRGGDRVTNTTGILSYGFGIFRIQPTTGADYTQTNPRTAAPEAVGGSLKVASFNVLNYFTTLGSAGRGADNAEEFERQRAKIIAAISAINADIVGLIEIENNTEAIQNLVSGINQAMGEGTYAYVNTGIIGTDQIKVALIYKPATVALVGDYAILDSRADPRFVDTRNRPSLAQTFREKATEGVFTVSVNHLKSKGSGCGAGDDDPQQGNCNLTRTQAAEALVDWLASDPTGSGDPDFMIIGDLNSYDKEDPIRAIREGADDIAGNEDDFVDLAFQFKGEFAYSYAFDGQFGYLDYALASQSLVVQTNGVTDWHINSDEPDVFDYNTNFRPEGQTALYTPSPYRASDHDPVVIGLTLSTKAKAITLGDCTFELADFPEAAEIVALQQISFASCYYRRGSYVVGIATGIRADGEGGVWEIHNDCTIKPVFRTRFLTYNTTLLPDVAGLERSLGWHYEPYAISKDGQYIYANATNHEGYQHPRFEIAVGTVVAVKFQVGRPLFGRILSINGSVDCKPKAIRYYKRYIVLECSSDTMARIQDNTTSLADKETQLQEPIQVTVSTFPNPVADHLTVSVESQVAETATIRVIDLTGRIVFQHHGLVKAGYNQFELNTLSWKPGSKELLLQLTMPTQGVYVRKLIKQ